MTEPYYRDTRGDITIWNASCLDVLPLIAGADHVICDPPYDAEAHSPGRRARRGKVEAAPLDFAAMTEALRVASGAEMARIADHWILVFCQVESAMLWRAALQPSRYVRTQVWVKPNASPQFTGDRPGMGYESIVTCWGTMEGAMGWNGGGRRGVYTHSVDVEPSDRDTVAPAPGHGARGTRYGFQPGIGREVNRHTTEKPIELMRELIALFTNPGDLIIDPFMGSGTTLRAAKDLGRRAVGIEIEERWCKVAVERLRQGVLL